MVNVVEDVIIESSTYFAFKIFSQLKTLEENLFFSPFSIFSALAMVYVGARNVTETQLADILEFNMDQDILHPSLKELMTDLLKNREIELDIANSLWVQTGFDLLHKFLYIIKRDYGGSVFNVNFNIASEACAKINSWVSEQTRNKITEIINKTSLNEDTKLFLINAIYFKGFWMSPFKNSLTKDDFFTLISGEKITVSMMNQKDSYEYLEEENFQAIKLPYEGHRISMIIFLPKKTDGLIEFENNLNSTILDNYIPCFNLEKVKLSLPKFLIRTEFKLKNHLINLGIRDAFNDDADFSGITEPKKLKISEVIHKTFIEVNEKGTEAAAVTAIRMGLLGFSPQKVKPPLIFHVDHPFLFLIWDSNTRCILFMGRIMNPLQG